MMTKFDTVEARWLKRELSRPIKAAEINAGKKFADTVDELANKIYANDVRGRTLDGIRASCIVGKYGEMAIYTRLKNAGMNVEWNNEEFSGEYFWDVRVEGLSLELKYQNRWAGPMKKREFFSFDEPAKIQTAITKWASHDFVIGWYRDGKEADGIYTDVCPWVMIDSRALMTDEGIFVRSQYPNKTTGERGYYLQMVKAMNRGLMKVLIPI